MIRFVLFALIFLLTDLYAGHSLKNWNPFDKPAWLTSSFSESRGSRYHAGFDYSTEKETAWKISAPEDGQIIRVRVSPFGYGKALYFKGESGKTWVFAHLSGFMPKLQNFVLKYRQKHWKNQFDHRLKDPIDVDQGELLAFSGKTGIGDPHLHLEVRPTKNSVMNPALVGVAVFDTIAPEILHMALWDQASFHFFQTTPSKNPTFFIGTHHYIQPMLAIKIRDYSREPKENPMSIRSLDVYCGRVPLFKKEYKKQTYGNMQIIQEDLAWAREADEDGDWHFITPQPDNHESRFFNKMQKCFDVNSSNDITVRVQDFAGNESTQNIHLDHSPRKIPDLTNLKMIPHKNEQDGELFSFLSNVFIENSNDLKLYSGKRKIPFAKDFLQWTRTQKWLAMPLLDIARKAKFPLNLKWKGASWKLEQLNSDSIQHFSYSWGKVVIQSKRPGKILALQKHIWNDSILGEIQGVQIHPKGLALKGKMEICLNNQLDSTKHLFYLSGSGHWNSFSNTLQDSNFVCTQINEIRDVALGTDKIAPELTFAKRDTIQFRGEEKTARFFTIVERGAGIGNGNQIQSYCNDQWIPNEFDQEEGGLWILDEDCNPNSTLKLELKDDFKNHSSWIIHSNLTFKKISEK